MTSASRRIKTASSTKVMRRKILHRVAITLAIIAVAGAALVTADRGRRKHALALEEQRLQEMLRGAPTTEELIRRLGRPPTQEVPATEIEQIARAFRSMTHRVEEMRAKARSADRVLLYGSHQWVYIFYLDQKGVAKDFTCFEQ